MRYRDFEIRLRSDPQGNLWASLIRPPHGAADSPFLLPLANGVAEALLQRTLRDAPRREASVAVATAAERHLRPPGAAPAPEVALPSPREVGEALFEALLAGDVAGKFAEELAGAQASAEAEGVRLLLSYSANDTHLAPVIALPWELLAKPGGGDFLARSLRTPFTRYPLSLASLVCPEGA